MKLSQGALEEFKQIYFRKFGEKISDEVANEYGLNLLQFVRLIYRSIPKTNVLIRRRIN